MVGMQNGFWNAANVLPTVAAAKECGDLVASKEGTFD